MSEDSPFAPPQLPRSADDVPSPQWEAEIAKAERHLMRLRPNAKEFRNCMNRAAKIDLSRTMAKAMEFFQRPELPTDGPISDEGAVLTMYWQVAKFMTDRLEALHQTDSNGARTAYLAINQFAEGGLLRESLKQVAPKIGMGPKHS